MTMRRSVSQKLMSAPAVAPGERLWVPRDGAWVQGEVLAQANTLVTLELEDGAEHELDLGFGELHRANGPGGGVGGSYDDATAMRHLNEPELLRNLRARYLADEAYTRVGTVLVAVNPLKAIPQPRMRAYADADNAPADYAAQNVPYTPSKRLRLNPEGADDGDFVFLLLSLIHI